MSSNLNNNQGWQVYMVHCADNTLYTGMARDLKRRLRQHNGELAGGPRYTRGRRPVALVWSKTVASRGAALSLEATVKKLSRAQKQLLFQAWSTLA